MQKRQSLLLPLLPVLILVILAACKKSNNATSQTTQPPPQKKIAYVYMTDSTDGVAFKTLLQANKCAVTLVEKAGAAAFDYSTVDLIVIDDKSSLPGKLTSSTPQNSDAFTGWTAPDSAAIQVSTKPVLLIGEGGSLYACRISNMINFESDAFGSTTDVIVSGTPTTLYQSPSAISLPANDQLTLFNAPSAVIEFYFSGPVTNLLFLGVDPSDKFATVSIENGRYGIWGYRSNAGNLTTAGQTFLVNFVYYMAGLKPS